MNSGYNPKLSHPFAHLPQMKSQKPFYFGGSQVPVNLAGLRKVIKRKEISIGNLIMKSTIVLNQNNLINNENNTFVYKFPNSV